MSLKRNTMRKVCLAVYQCDIAFYLFKVFHVSFVKSKRQTYDIFLNVGSYPVEMFYNNFK